jgi:hypothetical protein
MAAKRTSRKRRKSRRPAAPAAQEEPLRGYARSRAKNEAAREALEPLEPGERPPAVTVGAVAAALLAIANLIALVLGYNSGEETLALGSDFSGSVIVTALLGLVAYGMWKARYWAVLGMQTLLAITIIFSSLALVTVVSIWGALLLVLILTVSVALFWFLVKAMARIQMPPRPGSEQRSAGR